ncbi:Transcriptional regulator, AraC family [Photobacterium marinum]|uniref:Transcriptional regulator, AraC family n=1 Tax=Photobacterium marinum TaxID=1056511 RepID=L8JFQ0_9GAMM|nr:DJ-1/PfpI family protein [Photobacterium marinum]ELR66237.1 Transcriptional regulator, AraC family [Photobacterium marinum]
MSNRRNVYFVVLPNMMALDIVGAAETLNFADDVFNIIYVGQSEEVKCSTGLVIGELSPLPEVIPSGSLVVLPGVSDSLVDFDNKAAEATIKWVKKLKPQVDNDELSIVCICSGALLAAKAGLLDNRKCTTHHEILDRLRDLSPLAKVKENLLFIEDKGVFTCAGIMAGIDLALSLVRKYCGDKVSMQVAREMVVYFPRNGKDNQVSPWLKFRHHHHPVIHRAQDAIVSHPENNWTLENLSREVHVSARHLSRLFNQYLNISVKEYHERMKLVLVDKHLNQGIKKEKAVILAGFNSVRQFKRAQERVASKDS